MVLCLSGATVGAQEDSAYQRYEEALRHFGEDDLEGAVIALKDALRTDSRLLPGHVLMARIFLRISEPAAAEEYLLRARRLGADPSIIWPLQVEALFGKHEFAKLLALTPARGLTDQAQAAVTIFRGRAELELRQFARAKEEFHRAAALRPRDPLAHVLMAVTSLREGDATSAREHALTATRLAPEDAQAWSALADVAHVQGELREALTSYDRALQLNRNHLEARLSRAGIYLDLGKLEQAETDIMLLRERAPLEPRGAYLQAVLLAKQGRRDESREAMRTATALLDDVGQTSEGQSMQYALLAGLASFELGEFEQAQNPLTRYVERFPQQVGPRKLLATVLLRNDRVTEAIAVLEPALERAPDDYRLLGLLGSAYMRRERYDLAHRYFERAVQLSDGDGELRGKLALALIGRGMEQEGLKRLVALVDEDPEAHGPLGITLTSLQLQRGDAEAALATATRLAVVKPRNVTVLNLLGAAQLAVSRAADARASFRKAMAVEPSFMPARINLGKLEAGEGNLEEARRILTDVVDEHSENTRASVELAKVNILLGRQADALRLLQKAVASNRGSRVAALALVDLHLAAGEHAEAMRVVTDAESVAPEDMDVLQAMARVHAAQGRDDLASGIYKRMSLLAGFDSTKLIRIARLQSAAGESGEAMFSVHKALQTDKDNTQARQLLAGMQIRAGLLEQAREQSAILLERAPRSPEVLRLAGDVAMAEGHHLKAASYFEQALEFDVSSTNALRLYGALLSGGAVTQGVEFLEGWCKEHPEDVDAKRALAETYLAGGMHEMARARYEDALVLRPHDAGMLNNMALILDFMGEPGALTYAEKAFAIAPGDVATLDTLGWLLVAQGEAARGLGYLRDAHSRASGNPQIRYHVATALVALNRTEEAKRELEAVLNSGQPFDGRAQAKTLMERLER